MMHRLLYRSAGNGSKAARCRVAGWQVHFKTRISSRGLHSEVEGLPSTNKARGSSTLPPQQFTIVVDKSGEVTIQKIVDNLPTFQRISKQSLEFVKRNPQAVFILATPNFASWLDVEVGFISKALQRIVGTQTGEPVEVDVICACIDGLSPRPESMKKSENWQSGFAIRHQGFWSKKSLSDLWKGKESAQRSPNMQSTLTFTTGERMGERNKVAVTLPLANTLFKNQRLSTLLLSRWRSSGDSFVISRQQVDKNNVNISVFGGLPKGIPCTYIPTVPLTPVRQIKSGLGNIVRRIDFGDGDVGPASRELETSVTEYLAQQGHDHSTIDVWALVIPRDAFLGAENKSKEVPMITVDDVRAKWSSSWIPDRRYVGDWIDKGATLCRVLSGGGGWGQKQGLLSLDPQTTYSTILESRFDFSEGSLDEQQASALGNIAQEGAFIQFLVAGKEESQSGSFDSRRTTTVLGAVPSTVDEIHGIQEEELDVESPKANIRVHLGLFGCVSESGMFLQRQRVRSENGKNATEGEAPLVQTKIDLPYSYIYRAHAKVNRKFLGVRRI